MEIKKPFNLYEWIDENRHLLKPPVGNKNLYVESGDYIVMIVAGPNARKDYHYNETEELFFQIEGDIIVKTQQEGKLVEHEIKEGEMFLDRNNRNHWTHFCSRFTFFALITSIGRTYVTFSASCKKPLFFI